MAYTIRIRRDTSSNWSSINPVLALGELGYDTTTEQIKVGNGSSAWNSLSYASFVGSIDSLTDVQLTSIQNGDLLQFDTSLNKWTNTRKTNLTDGGNF